MGDNDLIEDLKSGLTSFEETVHQLQKVCCVYNSSCLKLTKFTFRYKILMAIDMAFKKVHTNVYS